MAAPPIQRIAIVGFGEAGGIFGHDLAKQGSHVTAFDILFDSQTDRRRMLEKASRSGITAAQSLSDCLRDAELVISAVTASSALDVARDAGPILRPGQIFLDINSVSPETKRKLGSYVERSKAHFVEAAVMAGVPGPRLRVPMLLGGSHAMEASKALTSIGMNPTALSDQIGIASAVKMCRSVMMKGIEALAVECLFAARQYGAEDAVLQSLSTTYPSLGWQGDLPDYLISRVAQHGRRRAAEMREVAQTLEAAGIEPTMTIAAGERQERLANEMQESNLVFEEQNSFSWRSLADIINEHRKAGSKHSKGK